jgi:stage V sporulation protein S
MDNTGGLRPDYHTYPRQRCFVGHSHEAAWRDDLLAACAEALPPFGLEPWYAADHFDPTHPLREKVAQAIANARYGIYDLSSWQDQQGAWHMPRNVLIELGMAIALNRPALLLRHSSNAGLPLPAYLEGVALLEFAGEATLKRALERRLPQWLDAPPERDWLNRFCIFGGRVCGFREAHPRARQWVGQSLRCHLADGLDRGHPRFQPADRDEIRAVFEEVFGMYASLAFDYLDELPLTEGYQFTLCGGCQAVRSSPFAIYRITPHTPADVFIAIGMSIALETLFEYDIPKVLLVQREEDLPSLLRGYEVVEAPNASAAKKKLKMFLPAVVQKAREALWKPMPLPFVQIHRPATPDEFLPPQPPEASAASPSSSTTDQDTGSEHTLSEESKGPDIRPEVLKVSSRSRPSAVAGAIAGVIRDSGMAEVQAIGSGATNQAIKAIAIAHSYLSEEEIGIICTPSFIDVTFDDEERTAIRLLIEKQALRASAELNPEVLKVPPRSRPSAIAGAIAGVIRDEGVVELQSVGAEATNQAIKAIAIARSYLSEEGIDIVCTPSFIDVTIDDEERTAIRLLVELR